MSLGTLAYFENHGNNGIIVVDYGTLTTDRYLLDTCTAVFKITKASWPYLPTIPSGHPIFGWIQMEKREVSFKGTYAEARCSYAGVVADTTPVYETVDGLSEDPIATHIKFASDIGGSPKAPINGAIFRYAGGGSPQPNADADHVAASNDGYVFDSFQIFTPGGKTLSKFAKQEVYLAPFNQTFRKTYNTTNPTVDTSMTGYIDVPDGPAPDLGGSRNWLNMGYTITQRGLATQVIVEWRASGPRGWNPTIYTK